MKRLLDVSVLLAAIWKDHPEHQRAAASLEDKPLAVCPLATLGFLRISSDPGYPFAAPMKECRKLLRLFQQERDVDFVPDDLPVLDARAETSKQTTDIYLASLADRHGMKLLTLDRRINHPAVESVPSLAE